MNYNLQIIFVKNIPQIIGYNIRPFLWLKKYITVLFNSIIKYIPIVRKIRKKEVLISSLSLTMFTCKFSGFSFRNKFSFFYIYIFIYIKQKD